ncbi:MAG TPA: crotonase/enoyl-CoA hydratase family protein [Acidimicrobiales bacterium]
MEFNSDVLTLDVDGHVATLWLDRAEARNAMGSALWRDLPLAAAAVSGDREVRALIIAAKGPHFSVGLDLKEFGGGFAAGASSSSSRASSNARAYDAVRTMQASVTSIAELAVPVIAAVHGYCIGGGVDLVSACDVRLCANDTTFSVRETKVAIVADLGSLQRLPKIISAGHLAELAYTGKDINAQRALEIGLVNAVYGNADEVLAGARTLALEIAQNSPLAVQGTKAVLAANDGQSVDEGLEFVARWNTMYLQSNDLREAMTAFMEKRPPVFSGD